jgi:hypothetical protein
MKKILEAIIYMIFFILLFYTWMILWLFSFNGFCSVFPELSICNNVNIPWQDFTVYQIIFMFIWFFILLVLFLKLHTIYSKKLVIN